MCGDGASVAFHKKIVCLLGVRVGLRSGAGGVVFEGNCVINIGSSVCGSL
jgi:hypothetical protein